MIDQNKGSFTQPRTIKEILDELETSENDYDKAFFTSQCEKFELHLKK